MTKCVSYTATVPNRYHVKNSRLSNTTANSAAETSGPHFRQIVPEIENNNTKLLMTFEAKSRPTVFAPIQLLGYTGISMLADFADAGYPETFGGKYRPKYCIMVLVYYGTEDIDEDLYFQSIYEHLPDWLKPYILQCKIIVINMRKYRGRKFPGPPIVRAWAEALTWIPEGKLSKNLGSIFSNFPHGPKTEVDIEMTRDIFEVCFKKEGITEGEVDAALSDIFTNTEDREMFKKGFYQEAEASGVAIGRSEGVAIGRTEGRTEGKVEVVRNMQRGGFDSDTIAKMTGLSPNEIANLK